MEDALLASSEALATYHTRLDAAVTRLEGAQAESAARSKQIATKQNELQNMQLLLRRLLLLCEAAADQTRSRRAFLSVGGDATYAHTPGAGGGGGGDDGAPPGLAGRDPVHWLFSELAKLDPLLPSWREISSSSERLGGGGTEEDFDDAEGDGDGGALTRGGGGMDGHMGGLGDGEDDADLADELANDVDDGGDSDFGGGGGFGDEDFGGGGFTEGGTPGGTPEGSPMPPPPPPPRWGGDEDDGGDDESALTPEF